VITDRRPRRDHGASRHAACARATINDATRAELQVPHRQLDPVAASRLTARWPPTLPRPMKADARRLMTHDMDPAGRKNGRTNGKVASRVTGGNCSTESVSTARVSAGGSGSEPTMTDCKPHHFTVRRSGNRTPPSLAQASGADRGTVMQTKLPARRYCRAEGSRAASPVQWETVRSRKVASVPPGEPVLSACTAG